MCCLAEINQEAEDERDRNHVPAIRNETALENGNRQAVDEHARTLQ